MTEAEQCGWLVDRFGVSWQIRPENMGALIQRPGAFARLLNMKKNRRLRIVKYGGLQQLLNIPLSNSAISGGRRPVERFSIIPCLPMV